MEEITITINIADRPYRLKIKRDEEVMIRKAVREIELRLKEYSSQFAFQDKQDLLAMALLHFSATALKLENEPHHADENVVERLKKLEELLTEHLEKV